MPHPNAHPPLLLPAAKIIVIQSSHIFMSGGISVNCSIVIVLLLNFSYFVAISVNFLLLIAARTPRICIPAYKYLRVGIVYISVSFFVCVDFYTLLFLLFLLLWRSTHFHFQCCTALSLLFSYSMPAQQLQQLLTA